MTLWPYRLPSRLLVGLLLIDLPAIVAVLIVGSRHGYVATYNSTMDWRMQHPWSLLPSLVIACWLVVRWRRA